MLTLTTSPFVKTYTPEEFWALPEPKDGSKMELIAGVLYLSSQPDYRHNLSSAALNQLFFHHQHESYDQGFIFAPRASLVVSPDTQLEPDLFYLSARTLKRMDDECFKTADLAVEIISPSTAIYDRNTKADTYAALGVRELWLVDPDHEIIEVRHLLRAKKGQKGRYGTGQLFKRGERVVSKVFPLFSPAVTDICRAVPPKTK